MCGEGLAKESLLWLEPHHPALPPTHPCLVCCRTEGAASAVLCGQSPSLPSPLRTVWTGGRTVRIRRVGPLIFRNSQTQSCRLVSVEIICSSGTALSGAATARSSGRHRSSLKAAASKAESWAQQRPPGKKGHCSHLVLVLVLVLLQHGSWFCQQTPGFLIVPWASPDRHPVTSQVQPLV